MGSDLGLIVGAWILANAIDRYIKVLKQIHKTKRPVVLTVNGKAEAVLLAAKEYEKIANAFNLLKLLIPAEEDISNNRYKEASAFFKEFKREKKISG